MRFLRWLWCLRYPAARLAWHGIGGSSWATWITQANVVLVDGPTAEQNFPEHAAYHAAGMWSVPLAVFREHYDSRLIPIEVTPLREFPMAADVCGHFVAFTFPTEGVE